MSPSSFRARRRVAVAALALPLALASCSGGQDAPADVQDTASTSAEPVAGGTLTFVHDTEPVCIDPQQAANWSLDIGRNLADSLLDQDPETYEFHPWLASDYTVNDDATVFTFTVRDDVTFSDGSELSADVVKANFDTIKEKLGASSGYLVGVFSAYEGATVDGDVVTVTFSSPNRPFLQAVSSPSAGILSAASLESTPEERCQGEFSGSGPFTLDAYETGSSVALTRREDYDWATPLAGHTGPAYLEHIEIPIVTESSAREGALQSGEVDGIRNPSAELAPVFKEAPYWTVTRPNPGIVTSFDWIYTRDLPNDPAVRQAVQKAVNREEITTTLWGESRLPATSVLSSGTRWYADQSDLLAYDPQGAKEILEEAGWEEGADGIREKDGARLSLSGVFFDYQKGIGELAAQTLAEVGIELTVTPATSGTIGTEARSGDYDFFAHANTSAEPDILRNWFSTKIEGYRNITDNGGVEDLLDAQLAESDEQVLADTFAQIQQQVLEGGNVIPIVEQFNLFAFDESVHDVRLDAQASSRFYDAWVEQ